MEKPAETQYPIHDLLKRRWSPRAFDERAIETDKLHSLFEAARWAPSSNNAQPWRLIVATKGNRAEWDRLFNCLFEGNQRWADRAPLLILSVAKMTFDNHSPNRHAFHDVGLAVENLVLQATALGLASHQMAGLQIEKACADLQIPSGYEPVAMIAIGYPGDLARLPERLRERESQPRTREPISSWVFTGQWGQSFRSSP